MKNLILFSTDALGKDALGCLGRGGGLTLHINSLQDRCIRFSKQGTPLLPLSMARPGEKMTIKEIIGGRGMRAMIASMGLRQEDPFEVISNNGDGRLIVGFGQTRLALGRGIAHKIMVSVLPPDQKTVCSLKDICCLEFF